MPLDSFVPNTIRDVSATVAAWLIAQGYAEPEMRRSSGEDFEVTGSLTPTRWTAHDRRQRRRSTDR